ncbi:hypothetical protein FJ364_04505 [Candidatus Dependentiae bacterium]|nr:hypothetical protein [Candidatus Dependentiae bacterium]
MKNTSMLRGIKAQFIVDAKGKKKQVVLDIDQFEELLEVLEDYYDIAQAAIKKHKTAPVDTLENVKKRLLK